MPQAAALGSGSELTRWKLFLALSRTPHGLLDLATPVLAAVLWLGSFPAPAVMALGLATAFAGYTAVYALNDLIDYRADREKVRRGFLAEPGSDLDALFVRHPLAQDLLSFREGLFWVAAWTLAALAGAYRLSPVSGHIFVAACATEAVYCLLLRVHPARTLVSGVVKISGGLAALFAVDANPSLSFVALFAAWLFLWEIGGQNIPNDLMDVEEDRALGARTLPVSLGPRVAAALAAACLGLSCLLGPAAFLLSLGRSALPYAVGTLLTGALLLGVPAVRVLRGGSRSDAAALFNRASYYPLAVLALAAARAAGGP